MLSSYAGFTKTHLVVVFDSYRTPGGEKLRSQGIQIVFTREGETADRYIQELAARIGGSYSVRVATSDSLVQLSALGSGVLRLSARELLEEVRRAAEEMRNYYST